MAVFSYVGGSVSMATGGYGNLAIRKGAQVAVPNTITTSARSFIEGTPAAGLFDPVDRGLFYSRISHGSGYSATKINFNTTEPYNSGAYSTSSYYTPYNTVFQDLDYSQYNTQSPSGEYWAHAYGYINSEFGTAIAVDRNRNAWVLGSTDYCSCTITSVTASLTTVGSFTNSTTTPTSGTNDSGYFFPWTLPFNQNIFGLNDNTIVVQSNSWLSFQPLINNTLTAFTGTSPGWANIQIGAGEASCQRLYWGTFGIVGNRTFRIRFEGTNATTGTLGSPNMVWEFILYESNPNIFDIQIGAWTPPATNANGITDGTTYFGTFTPTANTGWRFNTGNVTSGASGNNITLVKYSNKGQFHRNKDFFPYTENDDLIVVSIGRNGSDVGEAIKIGSDGRIYILYTSNSQGYVSGVANNDLGIIKIDPDYLYKVSTLNNATVWNKSFGTTSNDSAQSFDIDANDNLYITGFTAGSGQGNNDIIVIKVDKTGTVVWKRTYGAVGGELGQAIKYSPDGNLYVWGISSSSPLINATADFYLLKINGTTGAIIWQKHFNIGASTNATIFENSVDVDPDGNVYVNGFGAASPQSYFVAKLDSSGNFKWSRNVGALTGQPDVGTTIKYKNGFVYVAGQDTSTFNNSESYGLGVSKLDANTGQLISNYVVGGVSTEYAFAIDVDAYNDIYATGVTNTSLPGLTSASGVNAFTTKFILDTPQGGFTVSGDARVWSSTTAKRYTTSRQAFTAEDIVFQNDLIATGQQFIFVGTTSETQVTFEKQFTFVGSGSLPALTSTLEEISIQTTQYQHRTNLLSDITKYFRTNISSVTSATSIPNPVTGLTGDTAVYNVVTSSSGAVFPGYLDPRSSTGVFATNTTVFMSIFAKANTWGKFRLVAYSSVFGSSGALPNHEIQYDVSLGTATNLQGTNAPLNYGIEPFANGWYRCWIKLNVRVASDQSGGSGWFQIKFSSDSSANNSMYWYGPQLQKDILTSYVQNIGSTALTTTAFITDNNVNTLLTFDSPETTPSIQLFTLSGTSTITYKNALNKPVQTYRGSSDLSLLNGYEVVFDPDLYTGKVQYKVYDSNLYSTEKFEKEFRFTGSGLLSIQSPQIATSTIDVQTRSNTYTIFPQVTSRDNTIYYPSNIILLRSGNQTLFTSSSVSTDADVTFVGGVGAAGIQLFTIGSGYTSVKATRSFLTNAGTNIINTSGSAITRAPNRHTGASPIEYYNPSQVTFGDGENFRASEFKADATAFYRFQKAAFSASGSIGSGDEAFKSTTNVAFIPLNTILIFNTNAFTKLAMQYAGKSPTTPFGGLEIVFEELEANAPPQQFKYSGAASEPIRAFRWVATTSAITITGTAVEKNTEAYAVSGQLTTGLQASAKVTFRPFDATDSEQLFSINGQHGTRVFVPNWRSVGTISITGGATQPLRNYSWVGSSPIQYFDPQEVVFEDGENFYASEFKYDSTALYRFQKGTFGGTGSITADPNASASVSFNPPDTAAGIQLFNVTGTYSDLKFVKKSSEASGNISITGTITPPPEVNSWVGSSPIQYFDPYEVVFEDGENFRASEFKYDSTALYRFQKGTFSGIGSITTDPNASAAVVFNPPEQISLFYFEGSYSDLKSTSRNVIITAPLFTGASGSATVTFNPPEFDPLFAITGSLVERYTKGLYTGDGSINSSDFGSARVTFRPFDATDSDPLFSINGQHGTRVFVPNWGSVGTIAITGEASQPAKNYNWIGSSPIQYFDPDDIVFGEGENFRASEFKYDSTALYRFQNANFNASGFITTDPNASAAVVFNPPDTAAGIQLFNVTGAYSDLRFTKKVPPDASALVVTISGAASDEKHIDVATGSGSTSITGTLVEKQTEVAITSGSLFVDGSADEIYKAGPFAAGGQITISGDATNIQFISQAGETPVLFQISGAAAQPSVQYAWIGLSPFTYFSGGQIVFEDGENFGASEFKCDSTAAYRFQNAAFAGSGSITTDPNASAAVVFNPPDTAVAIQLFTVSGQHGTRVFVPSWTGSGSTTLSGSGSQSIQYGNFTGNSPSAYIDPYEIVFGEEENYGSTEIALSGYSRFSATLRGEVGSGALFTAGFFSNLKASFRPFDATDSEQLFSINGQHGTRVFVPNWRATGSILTGAAGTASVTFNPPEFDPLFTTSGAAVDKHIDVVTGSGNLFTASGGAQKVTFRPVDATDTDFLFSITGAAGVKLRDYVWVSAVVEYDPYEYVINDEFIIPDFIKLKGTFVWDNVNNIYRSLTTESITRDITSGFAGASLVSQDIQGFLGATIPDGTGLDIPLETVSGTGSGATASYLASGNQIIFIQILSGGNGYTQGSVLRLPVGSNPTIVLGNLFNAPAVSAAIIQGNVGTRTFVPNWRGSGFISITGDVTDKHIDVATGSGNLFAASGASQSIGVNPPDDISLFVNVSGSATDKHIDIASGSGSATFSGTVVEKQTEVALAGSGEAVFGDGSASIQIIRYSAFGGVISFSNTSTAAVTFNPPEADPLFLISGSASQSETNITSGSGSIATDISAVSRVVFNPADTEQLFEVTGAYSNLKFTSDYNGTGSVAITGTVVESHTNITFASGTATFAGAASESQTDIAVPGTGTIQIDGASVDEYASGGLTGSGTLFIIDGGSARVTFNPPEGNQLFDVSGSFSDIKITSDYAGTGSATLEGTLGSRIFVPNWIGSGTINVTGESTQKHIDITSGSGALFTDGFYSNLKATFRSVSAVGLFDVTGTLIEKHIDAVTGSGSISSGFNASASVTFRPFDATDTDALFTILGSAIEKNTESYVGTGTATFSGTATESQRNITSGSGALFTGGFFSNLKATFRPFDATDLDPLFSINGSASEKNTESYVGSGTATFAGTAVEKQIEVASGSGTLFSASGAAEAFGVNALEDVALFDISGAASLRYFARNIGSGSITTGFGGTASVTFNPPEFDPLFAVSGSYSNLKFISANVVSGTATFSGTVVEKFTTDETGSGTVTFSGTAVVKQTDITSGSGSLFTTSGASESVGVNPPDDVALFAVSGSYSNLQFISANVVSGTATFSGTAVEKQIEVATGSGTATFSGTALENQTDITSGSGSLFTASGASESVGVNPPDDIALFNISGTYSNFKFTSAWVGTGTLFAVSGAAESVTFNPPDSNQLFDVYGSVAQSQTNITSGSGSLFTAFGGTASVTFNPPEGNQLFDVSGTYSDLKFISANNVSGTATFSGTVVEKQIEVATGSGSATLDGTAVESQADITSGSGSLFTASGSAEAFSVNPEDTTVLYDITGSSDLKFTNAYVGSGSLFAFSGAVVVVSISEIGTGLFDITDTATESTTYKTIDGTGSLFGFAGGVESVTFNPVENTQLFQVSGEVYVTTSFGYGGGTLDISGSGQATFRRSLVPQVGSGEIVSSGESANNKAFAPFVGSGSLFSASGSAQATTNVPPIDPIIWEDDLRTTLYLASGSASVSRAVSIDNDVNINISGSVVVRTLLPERVFATII